MRDGGWCSVGDENSTYLNTSNAEKNVSTFDQLTSEAVGGFWKSYNKDKYKISRLEIIVECNVSELC